MDSKLPTRGARQNSQGWNGIEVVVSVAEQTLDNNGSLSQNPVESHYYPSKNSKIQSWEKNNKFQTKITNNY